MGFYLSLRPFNRRVGATMFIAVAVFGVANLVFAFSTVFWLSFAALVVAGAADMVSVYIRGSLVQFSTPDAMRGRVSAVNMLFIGSSNELGEFRAGTSAAWLGTVPAAVVGGLCTLGVVGAWAWMFKPLRRVDRFGSIAPAGRGATASPLILDPSLVNVVFLPIHRCDLYCSSGFSGNAGPSFSDGIIFRENRMNKNAKVRTQLMVAFGTMGVLILSCRCSASRRWATRPRASRVTCMASERGPP